MVDPWVDSLSLGAHDCHRPNERSNKVSQPTKAFVTLPTVHGTVAVDIHKIEAVAQGSQDHVATIFMESGNTQVITMEDLHLRDEVKNAQEFVMSAVFDVALRASGQHPEQIAAREAEMAETRRRLME